MIEPELVLELCRNPTRFVEIAGKLDPAGRIELVWWLARFVGRAEFSEILRESALILSLGIIYMSTSESTRSLAI